jgi:GT2 family glycosyltransferase
MIREGPYPGGTTLHWDAAETGSVDVGIPTFGSGAYLAATIESVLGQTFTGWTLTISENGQGTETIRGIVEPYLRDPRIGYVRTGANLGGSGNATSLLRTGTAAYVAILHDDDLWAPGFLARRLEFLEANPTCGFAFSACDFIDDKGHVLFRFEVPLREGVQDQLTFLRRLYRGNMIGVPSALVRRRCYETVGAEFSASLLFYDYEMWLRLAARYPVGFLEGADASYRVHSTQTTQTVAHHIGDHRLALLHEAEKIVPRDFPRREIRRANYKALIRAALDARARNDRRRSAALLAAAVRAHPAAPLDPELVSHAVRRLTRRRRSREVRQAGLTL